jgi:hypothetical protein
MTSLSVLQTCAAFDHAGLVIVGFGSLGLIVASLTSPASETAVAASGGTTPPSPWKDENGRIAFAPPAALMGPLKMPEPSQGGLFPFLFNRLRGCPSIIPRQAADRRPWANQTKD